MRAVLLYLALVALFVIGWYLTAPRASAEESRREYVRVTYYTLPGRMADSERVHKDAAACSRWMPFGTQLMLPDGYVVTCEDRGNGDSYWAGWIDIWSPNDAWGRVNVREAYGDYAWVEVIRWGWGE
jgi:hypothetical protein